jgi:glycosyltransferase involved in cell wall biosynthesis
MSLPRISLVTPNLNYGRFLGTTLGSVLGQAYPNLDYVVVDGGSTDDSRDRWRDHADRGVRWIDAPDLGQYAAINHGFAQTTGEIMGWLNSDDIQLPWTLATVASIFTAFPEVDWIMGAPAVIQAGAVQSVANVGPLDQELVQSGLMTGGNFGIIQQESCFWRRRLWERAGPLRTDLGLAGDFELWMRFARHAQPVACAALIGGFTVHENNLSLREPWRYLADVDKAVATLSPAEQLRRAKLGRQVAAYHRWRNIPGLKRLIRSRGGLIGKVAPVLRRDFTAGRFCLKTEALYP